MGRFAWIVGCLAMIAGLGRMQAAPPTAAPAVAPQRAVIHLGRSRRFSVAGKLDLHQGLLVRELARQALLLAAREDLQMVTRDPWLDEGSSAPLAHLNLDLVGCGGEASLFELLAGVEPYQAPVWSYVPQTTVPLDYGKLLSELETLSRGQFVEVLEKQLAQVATPGVGLPKRAITQAAVPPRVDAMLREMNFAAQFMAVRTLHALVRRDGTSPALVAGLARGYANLGLLTECYWHPMHEVFKARALLYAQRGLQLEPESAAPLWQRAYAYALVGLHRFALADCDAAAAKDAGSKPDWADEIAALCRYDQTALEAVAVGDPAFELAQLCRYIAAELSRDQAVTLRIAADVKTKLPRCTRIAGGIAVLSSGFQDFPYVEPDSQSLGRTIYPQLQLMPALPKSVSAALATAAPPGGTAAELTLRAQLIQALRTVNQPDQAGAVAAVDPFELSWPVLGRMILEETFLECLLLRGVPRDRKQLHQLLTGHSFRPYLLAPPMEADEIDPKLLEEFEKSLDIDAVEARERRAISSLWSRSGMGSLSWETASLAHSDETIGCLAYSSAVWHVSHKASYRRVLEVSPFSPFARAALIEGDWKLTERDAAQWEKESAGQPNVLMALGQQYLTARKLDDAERCLAAAAKLAPSVKGAQLLAEVYKQRGDTQRWIATLEALSNDPQSGVDAAKIPLLISQHFLNRRQFEQALPWAEKAANAGDSRGVAQAAAICEGLQDWASSEKWIKQMSLMESPHMWFFWCKRTGQGDMAAAHRLALDYFQKRDELRKTSVRTDPQLYMQVIPGTFYLLVGDVNKARVCFEEEFFRNHDAVCGLQAILIADQQQNTKGRDTMLADLKNDRWQKEEHPQLVALSQLFAADLAKGGACKLDWAAIDKLSAAATADEQMPFHYFVAVYARSHGNEDKAIEYWRRCITRTPINSLSRTLAGVALLDRGIGPADYKAELQTPVAP